MPRGIAGIAYLPMREKLLKKFNSLIEAELAKNFLRESGIKCFIQKRGLEWAEGAGGDLAGADLFVLEKDIGKAKEILEL